MLFALSAMVGISFGSIGLAIGLRTGNGEAVQGVFPLMFVLLFLSSGALPRNLIENDWFQTVATINPVSYLIEGFRSLFITGWDGEALGLAFGVSFGVLALGMWAATTALRLADGAHMKNPLTDPLRTGRARDRLALAARDVLEAVAVPAVADLPAVLLRRVRRRASRR